MHFDDIVLMGNGCSCIFKSLIAIRLTMNDLVLLQYFLGENKIEGDFAISYLSTGVLAPAYIFKKKTTY